MLANQNEILSFIPQRPPMVLIDTLEEASEMHAVAHFRIPADHTFVLEERMSEAGLIENIAQTAAAQVGFVYRQKSLPIPVGFIAAIKDLCIYALPKINARIRTRIDIVNTVMGVILIKGSSFVDDEKLCECEMRVFINA